jgi:predicted  nucleic acid-binding Zn-ribbon protein
MPKAKTEQEYKNEIVKFNVELLEPYKNNHTALRHRCLSCGNEWMITPHNILSGHGCPKCSHKKSKEEMEMLKNNFINSLSEQKRQTIELMEEFKGVEHPILFRCKICGNTWKRRPLEIKSRKYPCIHCELNRRKQLRQKTKQDNKKINEKRLEEKLKERTIAAEQKFIKRISTLNPNVEYISDFQLGAKKAKFKCKTCGYIWCALKGNILKGSGCPKCKKRYKLTTEEYAEKIKNSNITPIEDFIGRHTKIKHRCGVCGYEWSAYPGNILKGSCCPVCRKANAKNSKLKSHEKYVQDASQKNSTVDVIGTYVNTKTKILHRCKICGKEFYIAPSSVLRGCGCKECGYKRVIQKKIDLNLPGCPKPKEKYIEQLAIKNPSVKLVGDYTKQSAYATFRCIKCGHIWSALAGNVLGGCGCPKCNVSKGEEKIKTYLSLKNISFEVQKTFGGCKKKRLMKFDFYLPDYNLCIEYDGEQHFKPLKHFGGEKDLTERQENDKIKTNYCLENRISLLRIRYDENIEQALDLFFSKF